MKVTKNSTATTKGPDDWFTGDVYMDTVATPADPYNINATMVRFTPGARTHWHTHPNGQTVYITEGIGRVGRRGHSEDVLPGDRVCSSPAKSIGMAPHRIAS